VKRLTIKDIGAILNVNPSTVSRGLKDHPDISIALKNKIKAVAESMHYVPNAAAVNLRKQSSKVIGLIIPEISMYFIPNVINGINAALSRLGFNLLILSSNNSKQKEAENIKICCNHGVDGILISLSQESNNLDHFKIVQDLDIPLVIFDKTLKNQNTYNEVLIDDTNAANTCADYLVKNGCKNILLLLGDNRLDITKKREQGFKEYLISHKIKFTINYATSAFEAKANTLIELGKNNKIDGIFAMSDEIMIGMHAALSEINLTSIKKIVISDGILPKILSPNFAFLKHDGYQLGTASADTIISEINNKNTNSLKTQQYLLTELIFPNNQ
jgi:LacI family transcriptional regulator